MHSNLSMESRLRDPGQDHLHVAIDDATRLADPEQKSMQDDAASEWASTRTHSVDPASTGQTVSPADERQSRALPDDGPSPVLQATVLLLALSQCCSTS